MGTLNVITGERGLGKSTFASQLGLDAIKANYACFFYSGELNDWQFQNWMEKNVYGKRFLNPKKRDDGYIYYNLNSKYETLVDEWLGERAYLYDNNLLDDESEGLLKTIEKAIKQFYCQVIFIDNLMTAMEDNLGADYYRQQSNFVKDLKKIAVRFNVCIFLIAHPKKRTTDVWENDDISGSGNITNLADIVLSYTLPKKDDLGDRKLCILKNRINGRTEYNGIPLYFEEPSKRINDRPEFDWEYGWEKNINDDDGFMDVDVNDTPFT